MRDRGSGTGKEFGSLVAPHTLALSISPILSPFWRKRVSMVVTALGFFLLLYSTLSLDSTLFFDILQCKSLNSLIYALRLVLAQPCPKSAGQPLPAPDHWTTIIFRETIYIPKHTIHKHPTELWINFSFVPSLVRSFFFITFKGY